MPFHNTLGPHRFLAGAILTIVALAGCGGRQAPVLSTAASTGPGTQTASPAPTAPSDTAQSQPAPSEAAPPLGPTEIDPAKTSPKGNPRESWEAVYAYGAKIGWGHTAITNIDEDGRKLVQIENRSLLNVDREGHRITIDLSTRSVETPSGELLRFHTEMNAGPSRTEMNGLVSDGNLTIQTTTQGKTTTDTLPWMPGTMGFSATEESLADSPLLPGQRRTLRALMPATNEIVTIDLAADKFEPTTLLNHSEDLLRIDNVITLPVRQPDDKPAVIRSRIWTNNKGEIVKISVAALHQEIYRTTREIALADAGPRRLDLVVDNIIPVALNAADPHGTRRIRYRVRLENDDPAKVFFSGPLQEVTSLDPHTADIVVHRYVPGESPSKADNSLQRRHPTAEDRAASNLIQSDDERVLQMANSVAPDQADPWKVALTLEKHVKQTIVLKNFSQAFSTAAEVAQMREGDCTEHAVLLAALARARGIPARVAIGLVYQPATQSFTYHMWNELWIVDRWIPLDATLGRGGIGAAHLKLTDSNLAGAQAYSCFLPVAQVIGQLKIEVLEVE